MDLFLKWLMPCVGIEATILRELTKRALTAETQVDAAIIQENFQSIL